MNTSLTFKQQSNYEGFPKAAELIEIEGAHALEASDRAMFNQLLQTAHDSGRLTEADAEWEISLAGLRRASTKHESNDRIRDSLVSDSESHRWYQPRASRLMRSCTEAR